MTPAELEAIRREKDQFFKQHPQSPLEPEQQDRFTGLSYYPYNPDLDLVVTVVPVKDDRRIQIETTTGDTRIYERYARFEFTVDGQPVALTIYDSPHGYFLPFVDAGAPGETYSAGRYVEPELLPDGRFHVDFNQVYNPTCAYNEGWSCPITPSENRVAVHIRAGEKNPEGAWVEVGK